MWKSIEKYKLPNKANSVDAKTARLICDVRHAMKLMKIENSSIWQLHKKAYSR